MNNLMCMVLIVCAVAAYASASPYPSQVAVDRGSLLGVDAKSEDETLVGAENAHRGGGGWGYGGGGRGWGGGGGGWGPYGGGGGGWGHGGHGGHGGHRGGYGWGHGR